MVGDSGCRTGNHAAHAGDAPATEATMKAKQVEVISMRLDFMSMVLAVLARSLPPREAAHAVQVIGERVVEQLAATRSRKARRKRSPRTSRR